MNTTLENMRPVKFFPPQKLHELFAASSVGNGFARDAEVNRHEPWQKVSFLGWKLAQAQGMQTIHPGVARGW